MQSIDRAMKIARILSEKSMEQGMTISDLSKETDLPLSTMHRILSSMVKQRMVEQDNKTKHYRLGSIWMEYGLQLYDTMDYVSQIRPELERLAREVEESVYLSKPSGTEAIVMERIDSEKNTIRIYDQLGMRIPLHIGAANKIMLANMPSDTVLKILKQLLPEEQIPDFIAKLHEIKKQGYAVSHGERTEGTTSIAAAAMNGLGEVVGAVSVGVVDFKLTEGKLDYLIEKTVETGNRVSMKLGYRG